MALGLVASLSLTRCSSPTDPPDPPSGGSVYVLSFDEFVRDVAPVLEQEGCDAAGDCHGGGIRGSYELSPLKEKNLQFDFLQTSLHVFPFDLDRSPILMKPLSEAAGGDRHGEEPFQSVEDLGYVAIRSWVHEGVSK